MPKVSVIIPVYGVEKYIEKCARSLFEQTLDDVEFIFVDDCTPDRSIEILKSIIEEYRLRIAEMNYAVRIERMPTNSGQAAVRRHGIQLATGEYIIHCDSDDWVETTIYEKLYKSAAENDYDIVSCYYYREDPDAQYIQQPSDVLKLLQGPLWNRLVRRTLYTEHPIIYPTANKAEDGALMTQLSCFAKNKGYVKEPLYHYRNNPESICGAKSEEKIISRFNQEVENTSLRIRFIKENNLEQEYMDDILKWKYEARKNLIPLLKKREYSRLWRKTFPELNRQYVFSSTTTFRDKIRFIVMYLGLYR